MISLQVLWRTVRHVPTLVRHVPGDHRRGPCSGTEKRWPAVQSVPTLGGPRGRLQRRRKLSRGRVRRLDSRGFMPWWETMPTGEIAGRMSGVAYKVDTT